MANNPFVKLLISQKFKKDFNQRSNSGWNVKQYRKLCKDRIIIVQLWGDGFHRATHAFNNWECTKPTDFNSLFEMKHAIKFECFRRDHKHYDPDFKISHEGIRI